MTEKKPQRAGEDRQAEADELCGAMRELSVAVHHALGKAALTAAAKRVLKTWREATGEERCETL